MMHLSLCKKKRSLATMGSQVRDAENVLHACCEMKDSPLTYPESQQVPSNDATILSASATFIPIRIK
jgi:hypothetical protein